MEAPRAKVNPSRQSAAITLGIISLVNPMASRAVGMFLTRGLRYSEVTSPTPGSLNGPAASRR
jgi:hypothetical protein